MLLYPFERLTEAAKKTLILAQGESQSAHHTWVGTEHLGIALASQRGTVAGETLARIGVSEQDVRLRVAAILSRNENIVTAPIIPTARTKKVIEMSFRVAQHAGSENVWTDHILTALLAEGEGIAAHILVECGADYDLVRTTAGQVRQEGIDESSGHGIGA